MLKLLIKNNEYNQVLLVKSLISNCSSSISELTHLFDIQKITLNRYIKNLNTDFQVIFKVDTIKLVVQSDVITIKNNTSIPLYTIVHKLMTYYLFNSISYKLIKSLLINNSQYTANLIESVNISQSYFNKLIKQINTYISPTTVKIIQRNKEIFLTGDELKIIYLEYLMLYFIQSFEKIPLNKDSAFPELIALASDHTLTNLNDIQLQRVTTLYHAFQKRKKNFTSLTIKDNEIKEILNIMVDTHDFIVDPNDVNIFEFSKDAPLLANFLVRIISTGLDSNDTHLIIANRLHELSNPIINDIKKIINNFIDAFIPNIKKNSLLYKEFFYIMTLNVVYLRLFSFDFKDLFQIDHASIPIKKSNCSTEYQHIETYLRDNVHLKTISPRTQKAITNNIKLFIDTCYIIFRSSKKRKLSISFDFIYHLGFEHYLQNHLYTIFNVDTLVYVDNSIDSDIIITDHIISTQGNTTLFTFNDIDSDVELHNLLKLITSKL